MSVNIKTATGLLRISGENITSEKIVDALGYTPADAEAISNIVDDDSGTLNITDESGNIIVRIDEVGLHAPEVFADEVGLAAHANDSTIHVTAADKTNWNNKSEFSGYYGDLIEKPNIETGGDEDKELKIADEAGNAIAIFDESGFTTTVVTAQSIILQNSDATKDVGVAIDENAAAIKGVVEDLDAHSKDKTLHITQGERTLWNATADGLENLSYDEITGAPDITEDDSGALYISDPDGNVLIKCSSSGLETAAIILDGEDLGAKIDSFESDLVQKAAGDHGHNNATTSAAGFMSTADKTKLDGLPSTLFVFSSSAPATNQIWIDTSKNNLLKIYNSSTKTWTAISAVFA